MFPPYLYDSATGIDWRADVKQLFDIFKASKSDAKKCAQKSQNCIPRRPQIKEKSINSRLQKLFWKTCQKNTKIVALITSKTELSHWRGCIFQGFQHLPKSDKNDHKIGQNVSQKSLKRWSGGLPKTYLNKTYKKCKKSLKKSSKMRSQKVIFSIFSRVWPPGCPRVVPGTPQDAKSEPKGAKMESQTVKKDKKKAIKTNSTNYL